MFRFWVASWWKMNSHVVKFLSTVFLRFNVRSTLSIIIQRCMSRNLTRQILHDLHSDCFAMVLTTGFYCDSWAHKVRKVRMVKYIVVYGQIKAADKKYCHNQKWRRKLKEISFRTRGFWDNVFDDFWPRYCRAKVLDLSRVVEAYL